MNHEISKTYRHIYILLSIFIVSLLLSGITAFPLETELRLLANYCSYLPESNSLRLWIEKVYEGISETNSMYSFISYGTDWLAFSHIIIAIFFIGAFRNPIQNASVIDTGMVACILIIPMALIAGSIRQIPFYWQLIDCAFGIIGMIPLLWIRILINKVKKLKEELKPSRLY